MFDVYFKRKIRSIGNLFNSFTTRSGSI